MIRDLPTEVADLKETDGGTITGLGSGNLVRSLAANDLVDEYRLSVYPITLGIAGPDGHGRAGSFREPPAREPPHMDRGNDRPDKGAVDASKAPFTLVEGPAHMRAPEESPLPGWYEAVFATVDGQRVRRYLSDAGRARVLARRGEGLIDFTAEEFDLWTAPPSSEAIESRFDAEAGQGG